MVTDTDFILATAERVRNAAASGGVLRIRGGGSKDFYGEAAGGEVVDTSPLNGVVSYEPSELVVTALAGTPLAELEALLAAQGQCLPFEPPHYNPGATVGGMVAAGLSGPARASVGAVRDYVLGVKLINGKGEHLTFGGQVMKNVAGYDVSRLMVGAMGTLGLLTQVSLKVLPIAPLEATLKFEMTQAQALAQLNAWGGQPLPLNASCWLEDGGVGTLYLRLRGAVAAVESACRKLGGERLNQSQATADWQRCRDQQLQWFNDRADVQDLWRLSVPQTAVVLDLPDSPLIEWHGGQRWARADAAQGAQLREQVKAAGGYATLFIAASASKNCSTARFDTLKPPLDRIHRELKREFDPFGVFNPHRMHADW
ncbi:MAG: glycolate oxidase subunit GlcE [Polaromonas sp.]|nr:glycolate oxidase subunit GlcE [Polaromonas sp.]